MEKKERSIIGKVVSTKNDKTVTILVETYRIVPKYGKRVKYSKKYAVHDENNIAAVGDKIKAIEVRPISKTKNYKLVEVLEKAIIV